MPEQEKAVRSFVSSRDEFLSLPMAVESLYALLLYHGFSMSYISERETVSSLVVSPLMALMKDQINLMSVYLAYSLWSEY